MDDFVTEFNEKTAAKSREVCERIEREDAERRSGLSEVERRILEAWPRFEDGKPVWLDSRYLDVGGEPQVVHGVQLWVGAGEVMADLINEDGWHTVLGEGECAMRVETALDSRGAAIAEGDMVRSSSGEVWTVVSASLHGFLPGYIQVRSDDAMTYFMPHELTRIEPDSWGRLELDADSGPLHYCVSRGIDYERGSTRSMMEAFASDIIRRAKALAGVGAARDED